MIRMMILPLLLAAVSVAEPLKVMTWNIRHGVGEDGRLDLARVADRIMEEKPDVVALQEVDRNCGCSGGVDQTEELGRLTGMAAVFGKAMDFDGGAYGQAVLTRLPVVGSRVHRLPGEGEPRIAFAVRLQSGPREVEVVSVHLDHQVESRRLAQAKALVGVLSGGGSGVLCGDFNDVPGSATMKVFEDEWSPVEKVEPVPTSPAAEPEREIDHVLVRELKAAGKARVIEEKVASDHRPVTAVVE